MAEKNRTKAKDVMAVLEKTSPKSVSNMSKRIQGATATVYSLLLVTRYTLALLFLLTGVILYIFDKIALGTAFIIVSVLALFVYSIKFMGRKRIVRDEKYLYIESMAHRTSLLLFFLYTLIVLLMEKLKLIGQDLFLVFAGGVLVVVSAYIISYFVYKRQEDKGTRKWDD